MSNLENRKEATKTYIEQTKLLVTLSSAFIVAPPVAFSVLRPVVAAADGNFPLWQLLWSEAALVASVLFGYLTLGSVAGSQDEGDFNIYRGATRWLSWCQIVSYLAGLALFALMVKEVLEH